MSEYTLKVGDTIRCKDNIEAHTLSNALREERIIVKRIDNILLVTAVKKRGKKKCNK